jgi:hypothetical protein
VPGWPGHWRLHPLWYVEPAYDTIPSKAYYLKYVRRSRDGGISGKAALAHVEDFCRKALGVKVLLLQDNAWRACHPLTPSSPYYHLGFREMLRTGKTWYQQQGYRLGRARGVDESSFRRLRSEHLDRVPRSLAAYARTPVSVLLPLMQSKDFEEFQEYVGPRRMSRLRALVQAAASDDATMGPWLLSLDCRDYAFFMRTMYGVESGPKGDVERERRLAMTVSVPTLHAFDRADAYRRFTYRIEWYKELR